jgi:CRISPR-associated protein Cmr5
MKVLEHERAKFAFSAVSEVKEDKSPEVQKKYSTYVKSAPIMMLSNGLPATLAFYLSKMKMRDNTTYVVVGKEIEKYKAGQENKFENKSERVAYAYLFYHISKWLAEGSNCGRGLTNREDPLQFILKSADILRVLQLTREALFLLSWMKRFADAMLEKEE